MVWEQGPGVDGPGAILCKPGQSSDEIIPIKAIEKDLFSLNSPTDNPAERGTGHRGHPIVLISACRRYSHDPTRYVKHVLHERPLFSHISFPIAARSSDIFFLPNGLADRCAGAFSAHHCPAQC